MKTLYYFFKAQIYELLTGVFAVISIIIVNCLRWPYIVSILTVLLYTSIIVYLKSRDKSFYFISLKRRKQKDEWFGGGDFDYSREVGCYSISSSDSGYIYSKCLTWSDYALSFKFKIIKDCLGVIVRAINLSNYVMLQIDKRTEGIRPHIRVNGGWRPWEAKDCGLAFNQGKDLSLDKWYQCHISCVNRSINIKLSSEDGKEEIFNRHWNIPPGSLIFSFGGDDKRPKVDIPFSISLEYGSIGFRNDGQENALIKEVLITKL